MVLFFILVEYQTGLLEEIFSLESLPAPVSQDLFLICPGKPQKVGKSD